MENLERPRLTVDLEPAQKRKLKDLFPWGTQRSIVIEVLDLTIAFFERYGRGVAFDAIITGRAKIVIIDKPEMQSAMPDDVLNALNVRKVELSTYCSVCGLKQYETPSGVTCPNGHGGADGNHL